MHKAIEITLTADLSPEYDDYGCEGGCSGPDPRIEVTINEYGDISLYESIGCYDGANAYGKDEVLEYLRAPHPNYVPESIDEMIAEVEAL